jgi:hypothetical protein
MKDKNDENFVYIIVTYQEKTLVNIGRALGKPERSSQPKKPIKYMA